MKAQKAISTLATLSILSFAVACNSGGGSKSDRYAEGFAAGKAEGYREGYAAGDRDGYARGYSEAELYFKTADYITGYNDGRIVGQYEGYAVGYAEGDLAGWSEGYDTGYDAGLEYGLDVGYDVGYEQGLIEGFNVDAYNMGWTDGEAFGWNVGFDDGWAAAEDFYFGFSVGKTPKLQGYADVLSAFHNDVIDYSKIPAPVETKRGLVANGQLLLSEVSMTNKDTLKKAAVVEQYVVTEMAKQVQGKFGLSAERSVQVAKAFNHFRKQATSRALTPDDTNAYAVEITGSSFKSIEKAYGNMMKGDVSDFSNLMEKAAEKNGVSPEKMTEVITKLFI